MLTFLGKHLAFLHDKTPEIDLEGALSSGKTIVALWKELEAARKYPGICILIARWTQDAVDTLLRPELERVAKAHGTDLAHWDDKKKFYTLPNGSQIFCFGLKTVSTDPDQKFGKIRGLPVSRICVDQAEQLEPEFANELRSRLRPTIDGAHFPRQLTLIPNPTAPTHWLAVQFPEDNRHMPLRKYYSLSLFDNQHVLPPEMIQTQLLSYPPEHPMHRSKVLGLRGVSVEGDPVYSGSYVPDLHLKAADINPLVPLIESYEAGKKHPCVLWSQFDQWGRWIWLGGVIGEFMPLGSFCDIVGARRQAWFGGHFRELQQVCNPFGIKPMTDTAVTAVEVLRQHGVYPRWVDNANQPIIRFGAIQRTKDYMHKRTAHGEGFQVDPERWLVVSAKDTRDEAFGPSALFYGYIWDKKTRRTSNKSISIPKEDDWFEHVMSCAENTELTYGRGYQTQHQIERRASKAKQRDLRESQKDRAEPYRWNQPRGRRRAGY